MGQLPYADKQELYPLELHRVRAKLGGSLSEADPLQVIPALQGTAHNTSPPSVHPRVAQGTGVNLFARKLAVNPLKRHGP